MPAVAATLAPIAALVAAWASRRTFTTDGATGVADVAAAIRRLACARSARSGATTSSSRDGPARVVEGAVTSGRGPGSAYGVVP